MVADDCEVNGMKTLIDMGIEMPDDHEAVGELIAGIEDIIRHIAMAHNIKLVLSMSQRVVDDDETHWPPLLELPQEIN